MANIEVPRHHVPALKFLTAADEKFVEQVRDFLSSATGLISISAFKNGLAGVGEIGEDRAEGLVTSLLAIYILGKNHTWNFETTARAVAGSSRLDLDDEQKGRLIERLVMMLEQPITRELAEAVSLTGEREGLLHDVKFLTDIRPIFGSDVSERMRAAVLNHTLRLEYYDHQHELTSTFIALSESEIENLIDAANATLERAKRLREFLSEIDVRAIQTEDE